MGHGFGQLFKLRGIITYRISPFEQKAFAGVISHGFPNTIRRISENILYIVPPLGLAYLIYDQAEKEHHRLMLKNPADYENDE
ncbi:cytochrome b-c1 complex subunit 8 [Leptinotarsa decemlineata]|uniref:cytochrome b-c1 complex subunit 8 n=1 Tax=Leptinotarsa decemlineata TaxID=7539 RepID=UPI000C2525B9|nr:cytochrome b-c1 complex subunit 8 [Leptinotarsa decemlineata]XP_023026044.1 cytochrome b-c1 complex subunit 8 [Leptinotarsa decemlineata]XP_023026045.1 cytochrome b-c1 complex subunit 8 [Leptinotarsa decemlineata]